LKTNLGSNVHWIALYKVHVFKDRKSSTKKKKPNKAFPFIWVLIIYCSFVFDNVFLEIKLEKTLSENCSVIVLLFLKHKRGNFQILYFFILHPILMCFFQQYFSLLMEESGVPRENHRPATSH
jgi:hypothetical protein